MTDVDAERPDAHRLALLRRAFVPSSLDDVAEAVAVASEHERRLYVERVDGGHRWSLTHPGGGYPLLRIAARFLRVDYTRLAVGFHRVTDGVYVLCADGHQPTTAALWAIVEFDGPTSPEGARESIQQALTART